MGRSRAASHAVADDPGQSRSKRKRTTQNVENTEGVPPVQGITDGKKALYHCNYCNKDISGKIRIKCAICSDFDLCVECFSVGAEVHPYKGNHPYRVMDNLAFPVICVNWNADEEMLLLEGIEMYGLANWNEVAEHVGTKSKSQCIEHYSRVYMNSPCFPLPDMSHVFGKKKEELLAMAKENTDTKKGATTSGEVDVIEESPFASRIKVDNHKKEGQTGHSSSSVSSEADTIVGSVCGKMPKGTGKKSSEKAPCNAGLSAPKVEGKLLEAKRPHLYWTPCAAHCLDLMLEDIGTKIPKVKIALKKAMFINGYIYNNHIGVVNMMRRFTNQRNLHRPAITRFATSFITLSQMHKQRSNLKRMMTSEEWTTSKWSKEAGGKKITNYVLQESFWNNIVYALKLTGPIVKVLRMVDGEKKPPMGYIYEAMDRAKETISNSFAKKEDNYMQVFEIIDRRWECQLHRPLHAAGHYLNPEIYYDDPSRIDDCSEVVEGLYDCIRRLTPDIDVQDKIVEELSAYQNARGIFGHEMAKRQRKKKAPEFHLDRSIGEKKPRTSENESVSMKELSGYNSKRQEFEIEYDNDAEQLLADMEFKEADADAEHELKIRILHIYSKRLDERRRRKDFILERNLLYPDPFARDLTLEEKELCHRYRMFMRFHSKEEHDELLRSVVEERRLLKRIQDLQEARAAGCRTAGEAERYIEQKMKRKVEENAHRVKDSSQTGRSGKYLQRINHQKGEQDASPRGGNKSPSVLDPVGKDSSSNGRGLTDSEVSDKWDVTGFIGADILSYAEKQLCGEIRILPTHYLNMLETMSMGILSGSLTKKTDAHVLFNVDPGKVDKVYEMLIRKGIAQT